MEHIERDHPSVSQNVVVIAARVGDSLFGRPVFNTSHVSRATESTSRVTEETLVAQSHPFASSTWLYLAETASQAPPEYSAPPKESARPFKRTLRKSTIG